MTIDLKINPGVAPNGDIVLSGGDIEIVEDADATGQRIRDTLHTFQGEWFLDTGAGLPYRNLILTKNPVLNVVSALLKDAILNSAGEGAEIIGFNLTFSARERKLTANYDVRLSGVNISGTVIL